VRGTKRTDASLTYDYAKSSKLEDALAEYLELCRIVKASRHDLILDVGCGMNWLKHVYPPCMVVGVDIALNSRADVIADACCLPFRDKAFDVAVSAEVIEHMSKRDGMRMLREMCRVARRIAVSTVNRLTGPHDARHIYEWSFWELWRALRKLGVVILTFGFGDIKTRNRVMRLLRWLLPPWTWAEWFAIGGIAP